MDNQNPFDTFVEKYTPTHLVPDFEIYCKHCSFQIKPDAIVYFCELVGSVAESVDGEQANVGSVRVREVDYYFFRDRLHQLAPQRQDVFITCSMCCFDGMVSAYSRHVTTNQKEQIVVEAVPALAAFPVSKPQHPTPGLAGTVTLAAADWTSEWSTFTGFTDLDDTYNAAQYEFPSI